MPKGPDAAQRAVRVGRIATGQAPKDGKNADKPTLLAEMIMETRAGVEPVTTQLECVEPGAAIPAP